VIRGRERLSVFKRLFWFFLAALALAGPVRAVGTHAPEAEIGLAAVPTGQTVTYSFRPDGDGPFPTVLFLQGYPCRSAAPEDSQNFARNRLITTFADAGYLVHIAEKPGLGGGNSTKACEDLLYHEEVAAFSAVLDQLRASPEVDPDRLFIFGHSMGGQTAPLIARGRNVRGIVTYGIHAKSWFEFLIDLAREQAERIGIDPVVVDRETGMMIPFLYDLMIAKRDWDFLVEQHREALGIGILRADGEYLNGRHYRFWADLNDASLVENWAAYDGNVLALYGEYDIASISEEGAERIASIVNRHHPGRGEAEIIARTGHGFATLDAPFEDYLALRFSPDWSGEQEASLFNDALADRVVRWMDES